MSWCEDYIDPFDRAPDYDFVIAEDDDDSWECAFPDRCLMPSPDHHRSECYTVEDAEAYHAEESLITPSLVIPGG